MKIQVNPGEVHRTFGETVLSRHQSVLLKGITLNTGAALIVCLLNLQVWGQPETGQNEPPLRISDPVEDVIADLETYIPARMREDDVPGLAVAVVRDNQLVWSAGFGLANKVTGRAVTAETVFEAASISKVITSYLALRLVDQNRLGLDVPLRTYLSKPWLTPSAYADQVTLRHVSSHSSGLTENVFPVIDRSSFVFAPGSGFLYTGIGFMYLQEVVEEVTGSSLEIAARDLVFEPLGMTSSSLVNRPQTMSRMANGHMHPKLPLLLFLVPCLIVLTGLLLLALPVTRLVKGSWNLSGKPAVGACLAAMVLTALFYALSSLRELPNLLLLMTFCSTGFVLALGVSRWIGKRLLDRLARRWQGWRKSLLVLSWSVASGAALVVASGWLTVPVPRSPSPEPSAVGSLRTTAGDLAAFLIELNEPRHLSSDRAAEMRTAQIDAGEGFSWGLGIGIQHSDQEDALWQNAQTFGFRGLMVTYPAHGLGVVVLTNSDDGYPTACDVAGRALGGRALWEYF